jgi:hypothetical protein
MARRWVCGTTNCCARLISSSFRPPGAAAVGLGQQESRTRAASQQQSLLVLEAYSIAMTSVVVPR